MNAIYGKFDKHVTQHLINHLCFLLNFVFKMDISNGTSHYWITYYNEELIFLFI